MKFAASAKLPAIGACRLRRLASGALIRNIGPARIRGRKQELLRQRFEYNLQKSLRIVVEVLSPGATNLRRDREAKLKLYSRRGVMEYWIADWSIHTIEVYRRQNAHLSLVATVVSGDVLESPLLPGFSSG